MNLLQQLTFEAPPENPRKREYRRLSNNTRGPDTKGKYKAALQKPKTIPELARMFGYTIEGAHGTIRRYHKQGLVMKVGTKQFPTGGRPATLWQWVN